MSFLHQKYQTALDSKHVLFQICKTSHKHRTITWADQGAYVGRSYSLKQPELMRLHSLKGTVFFPHWKKLFQHFVFSHLSLCQLHRNSSLSVKKVQCPELKGLCTAWEPSLQHQTLQISKDFPGKTNLNSKFFSHAITRRFSTACNLVEL